MVAVMQVSVIAILIAVGYFLAKKNIFTPKTGKALSYLLVTFVTPSLIVESFQIDYTPEKLNSLLLTFLAGFVSFVVLIAFSYLYCGRGAQNKVERLCLTFSNVGFMGIPLIEGMYGEEGVFYAAIMVIVFNITFWTYGIAVVRGKFSLKSIKEIILSPTIVAVVVGLLLFVLKLQIPEPFRSALHHLSNLNTPLAMIVAGVSISQSNILSVFKNKKLYKVLFGKLIFVPVLMALVFWAVPIPGIIKEILVIQLACPVAAIIGISLLQNNEDDTAATEYFTLTTLASMATIPLIKLMCDLIF